MPQKMEEQRTELILVEVQRIQFGWAQRTQLFLCAQRTRLFWCAQRTQLCWCAQHTHLFLICATHTVILDVHNAHSCFWCVQRTQLFWCVQRSQLFWCAERTQLLVVCVHTSLWKHSTKTRYTLRESNFGFDFIDARCTRAQHEFESNRISFSRF